MERIPGYDNWKLAYPPHWDDPEPPLCERCGENEIEYDRDLCLDCYYELNQPRGNTIMRDISELSDKQLGLIFSRNLKRIMKEKNMLQAELASECKTDQSTISRYINNKQYPSGQMLVRMAVALETTVEKLVT